MTLFAPTTLVSQARLLTAISSWCQGYRRDGRPRRSPRSAQQRVQIADIGVDVALWLEQRHARRRNVGDDDLGVGLGAPEVLIKLEPMKPEPPVMHTLMRSFPLDQNRVAFGKLSARRRAPHPGLRLDILGRARRGKHPAFAFIAVDCTEFHGQIAPRERQKECRLPHPTIKTDKFKHALHIPRLVGRNAI